jgi:hypothetical protein
MRHRDGCLVGVPIVGYIWPRYRPTPWSRRRSAPKRYGRADWFTRRTTRALQCTDPQHALGPSLCCGHARKTCVVPNILVKRGPRRYAGDSTMPRKKEVIQVRPIRIWFRHYFSPRGPSNVSSSLLVAKFAGWSGARKAQINRR